MASEIDQITSTNELDLIPPPNNRLLWHQQALVHWPVSLLLTGALFGVLALPLTALAGSIFAIASFFLVMGAMTGGLLYYLEDGDLNLEAKLLTSPYRDLQIRAHSVSDCPQYSVESSHKGSRLQLQLVERYGPRRRIIKECILDDDGAGNLEDIEVKLELEARRAELQLKAHQDLLQEQELERRGRSRVQALEKITLS